MTARLNHTIVWCADKHRSSAFLAEVLSLPAPSPFAQFMVVALGNGVSMDFMEKQGEIARQHYAFQVSDVEFDAGMEFIARNRLDYWADPARSQPGEINRRWGGRGVYFTDPDGHLLELLTKPYEAESGI